MKKETSSQTKPGFAEANRFLKAVADNNRLRILCLLGEEKLNVTQIYTKLKLPQNLTSHHISKLKGLDLLVENRDGTFRIYSVNIKKLREYHKILKYLFKI